MQNQLVSKKWRFLNRKKCIAALGLLILIGGWVIVKNQTRAPDVAYRLAQVGLGSVVHEIAATGTLNAVVTVDIGSQVSGRIDTLLVDYNSEVAAGALIAKLDAGTYLAKVAEANAELEAAEAGLLVKEAAVDEAQAAAHEARRVVDRYQQLGSNSIVTQENIDNAVSMQEQAEARLKSAQAEVIAAQALIAQRKAQLDLAQVELDHTQVYSPIDGIVVDRLVEEGQTVAATNETPVLVRIVQDLRQMQLEIDVDEADIGAIKVGQTVDFTVDAYLHQSFHGIVQQIRKAPDPEQTVVIYKVIASTDNPELLLLPGMTADVRLIVANKDNVLQVPNAALRFQADSDIVLDLNDQYVWTLDENENPVPVAVTTGITDDTVTELINSPLEAGQPIIVGYQGQVPDNLIRGGANNSRMRF